ncbi:MAG: 3-hydroxyacyl-CoA dehydrogenase family protein [Desulfobacterales bacterium]|nr:3-hydroxyacyl-CoA dehydrogenase family protein [Desulfobacterales bacterium]
MKNIENLRILIAGAGTMGHGLALLMARAGHDVTLSDLDDSILQKALGLVESRLEMLADSGQVDPSRIPGILARIHPVKPPVGAGDMDFVLETISEDVEIKRAFFQKIAPTIRADALVASNTSYLNVFALAPDEIQDRLLICHFFSPPYLLPLVEIVKGPVTDERHVETARQLLAAAGQTPVVLEKFIPGFIVNRLQRALGREILHLIDGGYAQPEQIDKAVLASLGVRLPVLGVVRRYDFAGLDFTEKVLSNPSIELADKDGPSQTVSRLVAEGRLGVKSGKGFYDYGDRTLDEIYSRRDRLLIKTRRLIEEIKKEFWQG